VKVLGLSASHRQWGNTDLLVRHGLRGAEEEGAEVRFLRLADLALGPCTGCMSCVLKDRDCRQRDEFPKVLEALRWADAALLGSPAYVLGANGIVKTLQDRLIRFGGVREFAGKPAVALAAAGVPNWEPFTLPQVSLTFLFLGMPVVDQFIGYAQGPGEIFDDGQALGRARAAGAALGRGERSFRGTPGACPVCHFDLVTLQGTGAARCPLCDLPGRWTSETGQSRFEPDPGAQPRWSEAVLRHHFQERIMPSGPRFRKRLPEIRARIKEFRAGGAA
jgi:multimeric flavodoxin WrbA